MLEVLKIIRKYVENNKIIVNKINFDVLLSGNESIFKDILEEKDTNIRISLIYLYSNKDFMDDNNKYREKIIKYFKTKELTDYQVRYGSTVATNKTVLEREDALDIISSVVNKSSFNGEKIVDEVLIEKEFLEEEMDYQPTIEELYKVCFDTAKYIEFMDRLEKSSDEEVNQFVKRFRK